jgi:hypothetical protein
MHEGKILEKQWMKSRSKKVDPKKSTNQEVEISPKTMNENVDNITMKKHLHYGQGFGLLHDIMADSLDGVLDD